VRRHSDGVAITAAARALETRDSLGALNRVSLRDDAPALALRGIAMVQHDRYPERDPMSASSGLGSEADVERVTEVVLLVPKALIQMIARNRARSLASIRLWFIQNLIQERAEVFAVLV
jgi:hypothetical protein